MSRALSLAAASLLGCLVASPAHAHENLDAGKSAAQIFNGNCSACHRSAKGLLKTVSPSSLPEFLRQHYTTGSDMAQMLSGYLMSARGAAVDPRAGSAKRGPEGGSTLRPDAPMGGATSEAGAGKGPKDKGLKEKDAQERDLGQHPGRQPRQPKPDVAARPEGAGAPPEGAGIPGAPKSRLTRKKRGEPPPVAPVAQPGSDVTVTPDAGPPKEPDRSIDARVPVPEPVVVPPPTAADIKPEPPPAEPEKSAQTPAVEPPKPAPPAETTASAPAGPPAPPISQ